MISQTGQYALNALIYLADHSSQSGFFLAHDIGRELSIPEQYLSKILHILARKGKRQHRFLHQGQVLESLLVNSRPQGRGKIDAVESLLAEEL